MTWMGKIVGGAIGFALGGPLGAIAGAAFGHAFDVSENKYLSEEETMLSSGEESQLAFFVAAFSMLAKLAKVDGRISEAEIVSIRRFMVNDLNLDAKSQNVAIKIFNAALQSPESFQGFALQFYNQFQGRPQILELMIDMLLRVSVADGTMSRSEEDLILEAVRIFRFSQDAFSKLKSKYVDDSEKNYAILGCSKGDPNERIKKQYRKLVFEYHPDKIASKGLPEEFIKFANDKFREIQEAYDAVKKERGL